MKYEYNRYVLLSSLVISLLVWVRFGADAGFLALRIGWAIWGLAGTIESYYKKKKLMEILFLLILILASLTLLLKYL